MCIMCVSVYGEMYLYVSNDALIKLILKLVGILKASWRCSLWIADDGGKTVYD